MFGLLLGGLMGRAAAGAAAGAAARRAVARPLLGGLMSRRGGGGSPGGSVGGSSSPGPADQPMTIKEGGQAEAPAPAQAQAQAKPETPQQPEAKPVVEQVSAGLQERPTLQDQNPQPSNPTTPIKPLEGLLDTPAAPAPPQPVAGTKIDEPQSVVSQDEGAQPTATPLGDTFPNSPGVAASFLPNRTGQLPPRTTFIAPDANPSKPIDTSTKVNNASPGYSTLGMTTPAAAAPQFSYLRR